MKLHYKMLKQRSKQHAREKGNDLLTKTCTIGFCGCSSAGLVMISYKKSTTSAKHGGKQTHELKNKLVFFIHFTAALFKTDIALTWIAPSDNVTSILRRFSAQKCNKKTKTLLKYNLFPFAPKWPNSIFKRACQNQKTAGQEYHRRGYIQLPRAHFYTRR